MSRYGYTVDENGQPVIAIDGANWVGPQPADPSSWTLPAWADPTEWALPDFARKTPWLLVGLLALGGYYALSSPTPRRRRRSR